MLKKLLHFALILSTVLMLVAVPVSAAEDPIGCSTNAVGISLAVYRSDEVTPILGGGIATSGEHLKYRTTLSYVIEPGTNCNFQGGTVTITTPDGVAHNVVVGSVPLVTAGNSFASEFAEYIVKEADANSGSFLIATTSYSDGIATDGANSPVAASTGLSRLFEDTQLQVSKNASTTLDRTYPWLIDKSASPSEHTLLNGNSEASNWTITVTKGAANDSNWTVAGTITIHNPAIFADATVTGISDVVSGAGAASVNCNQAFPIVLAPNATIQCTYVKSLPDGTIRTNNATVATSGDVSGSSATASVNFANALVASVNNEISVTDTNAGLLGVTNHTQSWMYDETFNCVGVVYTNGTGEKTKVNAATITQTQQQDNASVRTVCTNTATLTVTKIVINDNGGTAVVADFPLFVGATPVSSGVAKELAAGTYLVSETGKAGYAGVISGDCATNGSVTLAAGQIKNCTITNDDRLATLTVVKNVINNNSGTANASSFTLKIDNFEVDSGIANAVNPGTYRVNEDARAGYRQVGITGDCAANGTVTLALGENKTCIITNDDVAGSLTVTKIVDNSNGGTANASSFVLRANGNIVTSGVAFAANAGAYNVSEDAFAGYEFVSFSGDCNANGQVIVGLNESKQCTITNRNVGPTITLIKSVINNDGGKAGPNDFGISIGGTIVQSGVAREVPAGVPVVINEANRAGYTFVSITGDELCPLFLGGTVTLGLDQHITCTITNDDVFVDGRRMTGGGSVFTAANVRVTHGFELHCDPSALPNNLEINWAGGNKFHLTQLTSVVCSDDPAIAPRPPAANFDTYVGTGVGRLNGVDGATIAFTLTDAGEPGTKDIASYVIKDAANNTVLTVTNAKITKGNQQAHK